MPTAGFEPAVPAASDRPETQVSYRAAKGVAQGFIRNIFFVVICAAIWWRDTNTHPDQTTYQHVTTIMCFRPQISILSLQGTVGCPIQFNLRLMEKSILV